MNDEWKVGTMLINRLIYLPVIVSTDAHLRSHIYTEVQLFPAYLTLKKVEFI